MEDITTLQTLTLSAKYLTLALCPVSLKTQTDISKPSKMIDSPMLYPGKRDMRNLFSLYFALATRPTVSQSAFNG